MVTRTENPKEEQPTPESDVFVQQDRCLGDPPTCCQPEPLDRTDRDDRLARLEAYIEWSMPLRCPRCGSDFVMLTLLAHSEWECWEPSCYAVWTEDGP